ncbi:hypothetical protein G6321_00023630 [Bradyrhizobium barranii subsp. barranii]|uniref:Uncharacterized protein n=1 Tax=Bradyrhizobium barranii subsp. barranii TaxID=2823807 RepID=A0A7Z0QIQ1_9BRAD|nr:hypothetical protein [Bradyrhizobium barranii]UGX97959.1 hypothetical protein G6321_00023630 [Bradyrhizobium barranii subsp. barranii]
MTNRERFGRQCTLLGLRAPYSLDAGAEYLGILVDPRDVAKAVRGPKNDGLPLRKVAALLGTHDGVVASLIAAGHLASYRAVNSVNRCPQTLVAPQEIKRFKATYVSLHELAKKRRLYIGTMKSKLDAAGIQPAFDPKEVGATFYLRRTIGGLRLNRR